MIKRDVVVETLEVRTNTWHVYCHTDEIHALWILYAHRMRHDYRARSLRTHQELHTPKW